MSDEEIFEYEVILVFPGWGEEREFAEEVVQAALDHLNIPNYEPGFRFAPNVRARLEVVGTSEQARDRLESDDDLAMLILHDLDEDDKVALSWECEERGVAVCHTMPDRGRPRKKKKKNGGWTFSLRPAEPDKPRAHQIGESALTGPLDDPEQVGERVWQVIGVLAIGVMGHHFGKHSRWRPGSG